MFGQLFPPVLDAMQLEGFLFLLFFYLETVVMISNLGNKKGMNLTFF